LCKCDIRYLVVDIAFLVMFYKGIYTTKYSFFAFNTLKDFWHLIQQFLDYKYTQID